MLVVVRIPFLAPYLGRNSGLAEASTRDLLHTVFLDPVPYQLWFVRNLMVCVAITPLVYLVLSWSPKTLFWVAFATWFSGLDFPRLVSSCEWYVLPGVSLFCMGAAITRFREALDKRWFSGTEALLLLMSWVSISVWNTDLHWDGHNYLGMVNKVGTVLGVLALWAIYDQLPRGLGRKIWPWAQLTFFAYLLHEPLQTVIWKLSRKFAPEFVVNPYFNLIWLMVVTLLICFGVGQLLKTRANRAYYYLVGGRVRSPNSVFAMKSRHRSQETPAVGEPLATAPESYQDRTR